MKKILQFLILGVVIVSNAQTPLHHFSFDNTVINDAGTISFNTTISGTSYTFWPGENNVGSAVRLETTPFKAVIPNLPQGSSPRTIMIKVKSVFGNAENPLFSYGTASSNQGLGLTHIDGSIASGNYLNNVLRTYSYGTNYDVNGCGIVANSQLFYLLTVTYDGTTLKVYKNTQLLLTQAVTLNTTGTNFYLNSVLGIQPYANNMIEVDDLKIYDVALTQQQIVSNYVGGANFNTGLLAFYDFENNLNSRDGNQNLTASGGNPNYYQGIEGAGSYAAAFEGSNLAYNTTLDAVFNNSEYTIAYWEYRFNSTAYPAYSTSYELFGSHYSRRDVNNFYKTGLGYANGSWFPEATTNTPHSTWIHRAYVFTRNTVANRTEMIEYENGLPINTKYVTGVSAALSLYHYNNKFTLGGGTDVSGNFLSNKYAKVKLDKFFIYGRALNTKEINAIKDFHQDVFNLTLSSNDFNQNNLKVTMYPNPVNNILNIDIENEIKLVEIYNIQGQRVILSNSKQIETSSLNSGIYMVRIEDTNGGIATQKLIKK